LISTTDPRRCAPKWTDLAFQIDYNGLAEALGLKDGKSATSAWCGVKKKLFANQAAAATTDAKPAATPKPKTPRKPKDPNATTTPKSKGKTAKAATVDDDDAADDDADHADVEPATPTTPAAEGVKVEVKGK
jgi:hypothetical protein